MNRDYESYRQEGEILNRGGDSELDLRDSKAEIIAWAIIAAISLAFLALSVSSSRAQIPVDKNPVVVPSQPPLSTSDWITFIQGVSNAHAVTVSFAPTYTSKLSSRWGAEVEASYPLGNFLQAGIQFSILDNNYFAAAGGIQAKVDFQMFGHNVTPYVKTYARSPLNNAGDKTKSVSALIGSGLKVNVWERKNVTLSLIGEIDYVTDLPGIQIFVLGGQATYHF